MTNLLSFFQVFLIIVAENSIKLVADSPFTFSFLFVQVKIATFLKGVNHFLIGFLLSSPEKMLIEICKLFEDGDILWILLAILSDLDGSIDNIHDESGVISISSGHPIFKVISYFYLGVVNEIIFCIVGAVYFSYGLSHFRSASWGGGLWIAVSKIGQDIAENIINFNNKDVFQLFQVYVFSEDGAAVNSFNGVSEDGFEIYHYVFGCELFGLVFTEIIFAEEFEACWNYIADRFN